MRAKQKVPAHNTLALKSKWNFFKEAEVIGSKRLLKRLRGQFFSISPHDIWDKARKNTEDDIRLLLTESL